MFPRPSSRSSLRGGGLLDRAPNQASLRQTWRYWSLVLNAALLVLLLWTTGSAVLTKPPEAPGNSIQDRLRVQQSLHQSQEALTAMKSEIQGLTSELENAKKVLEVAASGREEPVKLPVSASKTTPTDDKAWLVIGIPTIPRKNDTDYLTRTLESLFEELPADPTDPLFGRVRVLLMNNRPGGHLVFDRIKQRIDTAGEEDPFRCKAEVYLVLLDNPGTVRDPAPHLQDPDDLNNPSNRPGREVRRQTCDLITLMEMARPVAHYYMFMEDDFRVCPYALRALQYALRKLNSAPGLERWLALRVSYGMNGIVLRTEHLQLLSSYMRKHTARLPPDLLWAEWFTGRKAELRRAIGGRPMAVFRYNLLDHIGTVSSFQVRPDRPKWPGCFASMADVWSLQRNEKFNARRCNHTDLSPCPAGAAAESWLSLPMTWPTPLEAGA